MSKLSLRDCNYDNPILKVAITSVLYLKTVWYIREVHLRHTLSDSSSPYTFKVKSITLRALLYKIQALITGLVGAS